MTINLSVPNIENDLKPRIVVVGVGGAGGNAVNNMIKANLEGVEFVVCNTDAQALSLSQAERKIQLGRNITQGLGAGSRPDIGRASAEEALDEIMEHLDGGNMVFIAAGMGGGTGTGAAPVLARGAREQGLLTVGVITKPFHFEGTHRMRVAEAGIEELQQFVDTLIIIPNQNLFRVANEKTTFAEAFKMADDVLYSGVRGVTDLMVMPGLINLDFADIRSVMSEMGKAMMGTGEGSGERRSIDAAEAAISNPLLEDMSMKGARGVLINITGGPDMTLFEVDEAANRIRDEVEPEANIIFGSTFDEALDGGMRVSVVATGIESEVSSATRPTPLSLVSDADGPTPILLPAAAKASAKPEPDPRPTARRAPTTQPVNTAVAGAAVAAATATEAVSDAAEWLIARVNEETPKRPVTMAAKQETPPATFIAPRPVRPDAPPAGPSPARAADPFAAAALENGGREPVKPKQRAPSLFERVTGGGRPRLSFGGAMATVEKVLGERTPSSGRPAADPRPAKPPTDDKQPQLGGVTPDERLTPSIETDDLLDIPAFLRRQSN